jgi:YesN/AraC family two-component response regulator
MPELTGIDFAREIAKLRPDVPVVLMSGFGGSQLHERARAVGIRELLGKPLQRKDLAQCFGRIFPDDTPAEGDSPYSTSSLSEKPRTLLRLVDPIFNQARAGNIAALIA